MNFLSVNILNVESLIYSDLWWFLKLWLGSKKMVCTTTLILAASFSKVDECITVLRSGCTPDLACVVEVGEWREDDLAPYPDDRNADDWSLVDGPIDSYPVFSPVLIELKTLFAIFAFGEYYNTGGC